MLRSAKDPCAPPGFVQGRPSSNVAARQSARRASGSECCDACFMSSSAASRSLAVARGRVRSWFTVWRRTLRDGRKASRHSAACWSCAAFAARLVIGQRGLRCSRHAREVWRNRQSSEETGIPDQSHGNLFDRSELGVTAWSALTYASAAISALRSLLPSKPMPGSSGSVMWPSSTARRPGSRHRAGTGRDSFRCRRARGRRRYSATSGGRRAE